MLRWSSHRIRHRRSLSAREWWLEIHGGTWWLSFHIACRSSLLLSRGKRGGTIEMIDRY